MAVTATLEGFPDVLRARVTQQSDGTPDRAVVDVRAGNDDADPWPTETTLTLRHESDGRDDTFVWSDMRVVAVPRMRRGYMRVVLEDARHKLKTVSMPEDFNLRDASAQLFGETERTVAQLCSELTDASGVTIATGSSVPGWRVPAPWRGRTGLECLQQMSRDGVMRCLHNPVLDRVEVWAAGAGTLPTGLEAFYRPAPDHGISDLRILTAPILHEDRFEVKAVVDSGAGDWVQVTNHNPNEYFDGFQSESGNKPLQKRLRMGAFRFWAIGAESELPEDPEEAPDPVLLENSDRELVGYRALSLQPGAVERLLSGGELIAEDIASQLREYPVSLIQKTTHKAQTMGQIFHVENPFLQSTAGELKTTAELLTGYYKIEDGQRKRQIESRTINADGEQRDVVVDWLRPIDTSEDDIPDSVWDTLISSVADSHATKYESHPRNVILPGLRTIPIPVTSVERSTW